MITLFLIGAYSAIRFATSLAKERLFFSSRRNDFGILAALSSAHTARGRLYWDDGDVLNPVESQNYNLINFSIEQVLQITY